MKRKLLFTIFSCFSLFYLTAQNSVMVPAGQSVEIDYPDYKIYQVKLNSVGRQAVNVSVESKKTGEQVSGFGLGKMGKEEILVEQENKLVLKNENDKEIKVNYTIKPYRKEVVSQPNEYVEFTLQNTSSKSIPLIIPTVMNPNLSPFSKSGVSLKTGQEVLFKVNGKKQILLVVDKSIQNGDILDVAELLKMRKKELGIKK